MRLTPMQGVPTLPTPSITAPSAPTTGLRWAVPPTEAEGALDQLWETGSPDAAHPGTEGPAIDSQGRIWVAAHDGVHCFDPDGTLIGKLRLPEIAANLTFGGPKRNDMYITATSSLYAVRLTVTGARYPGRSDQ